MTSACCHSPEPVSVPVLFLSPPNVSCVGHSVLVSCESVQGSLPIQYTFYEKIPSEDSKISNTSKLALHCQSFKHQHHQYYCTASNNHGAKSSEMINVRVFNRTGSCSYTVEINGTGRNYSCETTTAESMTTAGSTGIGIHSIASLRYTVWKLGRWLLFVLMVIFTISIK
ncbi:Fc receptor-like protein 2 [Mobula hypostoma]|uniref:Fc receptor-like protein 2 n=1 Tax=Mobula hypostoma TaxID=723540 RepID=UPI002FC37795